MLGGHLVCQLRKLRAAAAAAAAQRRLFTLDAQLFPYHLAEYVCRVLRVTPFRYYCDLLYAVMREERSFDFIPNFTVCNQACQDKLHLATQLHGCLVLRAVPGFL